MVYIELCHLLIYSKLQMVTQSKDLSPWCCSFITALTFVISIFRLTLDQMLTDLSKVYPISHSMKARIGSSIPLTLARKNI